VKKLKKNKKSLKRRKIRRFAAKQQSDNDTVSLSSHVPNRVSKGALIMSAALLIAIVYIIVAIIDINVGTRLQLIRDLI